jgi:dTDP-4-amino-4,6-dideoxygalactose transaminase
LRHDFLPFSLPTIGEEEITEVADSLRSGWVTTGPKTKRFEEQFREYIGSKHAIAVNSCTAGLHIALTTLGVGPGDEVIVPTLTFCSTANVVVHQGARPVLVDVGEDFNVTPEAIEQAITPKTRAIVPVHYGGQPCDLDAIYDIAARHHLPVVEDAAHAIGAIYHGTKIGADGLRRGMRNSELGMRNDYHGTKIGADGLRPTDCDLRPVTCFSFYATKNMTTGEGGMITTADDQQAERMRLLSLHGMSHDAWKRYTSTGSWYYEVVAAGYKYNMTDIQAAIGLHQLRKLPQFQARRRNIVRRYNEAFSQFEELQVPTERPEVESAWHLYVLRLNLECFSKFRIPHSAIRNRFIEELKACNIGTSVHFIPIHLHPYYRDKYGYRPDDFPVAYHEYQRIISLPLYPRMSDQDVEDVVEAVCDIVEKHRK